MSPRALEGPLLVATANPGKVLELRRLTAGGPLELALPSELGIPWESPEETGSSYRENACIKAESLGPRCGRAALGEDSGLEVFALDGAPGLYSARLGPSAAARNQTLLERLAGLEGEARAARFVATMALWLPGGEVHYFEGELRGHIAHEPRGEGGFGYDPLFLPEGARETLGQLPPEVKDRLSHRARALAKLVAWSTGEVLWS